MSERERKAGGSREPMKFRPAKKNKISNYNKKQMLKMLKHANCHPKELDAMIKRFRVTDENLIKNFVNTQAFLSQTRVEQMLKSENDKKFLNLDQCARNLMGNDEPLTDNTLPVTLEAIGNLEKHPSPAELNGIDLKALYKLLANMSAGYPIGDLEDGPTKEFLKQCYQELLDSVSDMKPKKFKEVLTEQDKQTQPVYSWLCNSDYSQYLERIFKDMCSDSDNECV